MIENHNFCSASNSAVQDINLSLEAKGLYSLIRICLEDPDFDFEHFKLALQAKCKEEGSDEFNSAWEELKKAGFLKQRRGNNGFYYYELLNPANDVT